MGMFEKASRLQLRFATAVGNVTTEDLWHIPLLSKSGGVCLDDIAKALNKEVKDSGEESFVVKQSEANSVSVLRFDVVKHIIKVKLDEEEAQRNVIANKAKKQKILALIEKRQDADLEENTSIEDLQKMAADL